MLAHNSGLVTEIAYQVGFYDQAHFSKHFKKQFGCSPSQHQKHKARV
ncbi:MAG: helix-turn-helix domain-containing protein [bacterium]